MSSIWMINVDLMGVYFVFVDLSCMVLFLFDFCGFVFYQVNLSGVCVDWGDFLGLSLCNVDFFYLFFVVCDLGYCDMIGVDLMGVCLEMVNLEYFNVLYVKYKCGFLLGWCQGIWV